MGAAWARHAICETALRVFTIEDCNQVSRGKQVPIVLCWYTSLVIACIMIAHVWASDRRVLHRWNGEY
jgi:hypothetical protein